jgi:hypothetical protein
MFALTVTLGTRNVFQEQLPLRLLVLRPKLLLLRQRLALPRLRKPRERQLLQAVEAQLLRLPEILSQVSRFTPIPIMPLRSQPLPSHL